MFRRTGMEKNRSIGNKLDANNPINYAVASVGYQKNDTYSNFDILNNRKPIESYQVVVIPDYVTLTYDCVIWTYYIEQMNKIVESINYASDSYWGDPARFKFLARIDSFTNNETLNQGEERLIKTNFSISLNGYIVPDSINKNLPSANKIYSKGKVTVNTELEVTPGAPLRSSGASGAVSPSPEPTPLLLDTYSGAAAAYSLRQLSSTYTGPAIRVRVDTVGQPEYNIGFVDGELDTAALEGYCTGGLSAFVTTWYDQSGNGNDATQGTDANQPQIVSGGSVILENGKAAINWDGGSRYLDSSYTGGSMTSYISVLSSEAANKRAWTFNDNACGLRNKASNILTIRGTADVDIIPNATTLGQILVDGYGVDPVSNYVNGSLQSSGNQDQYLNNFLRIGSTDNGDLSWDGTQQELIFYNSDQSSNRTGIETNINDFYSIYS